MEIVVKGRHAEVGERFRQHAQAKLERLGRLDQSIKRIEVEVCRENNPRQSDICERVELTCRHRGPVVRAEASAPDSYTALDKALDKIEERLRRDADRKHCRGTRTAHHGRAAVQAGAATPLATANGAALDGADGVDMAAAAEALEAARTAVDPLVVREKVHAAGAMTVGDAIHQMELVGHDFFLFADADSGQPSVVYRRRGYDYGVLRLVVSDTPPGTDSTAAPLPPQPALVLSD
ncbi:MAG: sigma 54 modulation protein/ribosomal protein [Mycobacterium sp.]|jgi:ribosomal subunit interface protein|nr:sigma 54 modulation protein/ribosomal protein [Mycobacterium sp.]